MLLHIIALLSLVANATPKRVLLAISKVEQKLVVVDPTSLKVVARVPVGSDPHEVSATADGKLAYVSNTGSGRFHEINVIDLVAMKALPNLDTGALLGPHGIEVVNGKVWFTAQGAKAIGHYDPKTREFDRILGTGQDRTHMIKVADDEKHIFTTNVDSGTVSIWEYLLVQPPTAPNGKKPPLAKPELDWVHTILPVSRGNEGFDVSPDGSELWTATPFEGTISVVNVDRKKVVQTIEAKIVGAARLKFTPDGKRAIIVSVQTGDFVVYDVATRKEVKRLNMCHGAALLMDPEVGRVFVSCTPDNDIAVVDLNSLTVTGHINVGGRPDGLAWATTSKTF